MTTDRALLQKALEEAMNSLFTIAQKAGRDEYLSDMGEVRCYALNRGNSAASALATAELDQKKEPTNESVKAALAQSEQEHVGYLLINKENDLCLSRIRKWVTEFGLPDSEYKLYTHPQPERQPLSEEEIEQEHDRSGRDQSNVGLAEFRDGVRFAEIRHGIKAEK
jgi:hypothetical protein